MRADWQRAEREFEECPNCGRPLAWWTAPPTHTRPATNRHATCKCGAFYKSATTFDPPGDPPPARSSGPRREPTQGHSPQPKRRPG